MTHKDINDILCNLLTGQLTESDQQQLDAWLDESPENKQQFDELMNADDFVASYHLYHSIDKNAAWQKSRERIDHTQGSANELSTPKGKQSAGHSSPLTFKNLLRVAAAILLLVVGAYWYAMRHATTAPELPQEVLTAIAQSEQNGKNEAILTIGGQQHVVTNMAQMSSVSVDASTPNTHHPSPITHHPTPNTRIENAATLVTHHDKEFWMTLDDGTRVHLNYNTTLSYPLHFTGSKREVELQGEAYFFVAKNQSRPFIVHTPQGSVKVYGTEFWVKTEKEGKSKTTVTLVRGSVGFTPSSGKEQMLKPGQELSIVNSQLSINNVDTTPYTAWNTGTFVFENSTLEQLMNVLAQWYNINKVVFRDNSLRSIHFTGSLERYGSIERVISAITTVCDVEMEQRDGSIIIRKK